MLLALFPYADCSVHDLGNISQLKFLGFVIHCLYRSNHSDFLCGFSIFRMASGSFLRSDQGHILSCTSASIFHVHQCFSWSASREYEDCVRADPDHGLQSRNTFLCLRNSSDSTPWPSQCFAPLGFLLEVPSRFFLLPERCIAFQTYQQNSIRSVCQNILSVHCPAAWSPNEPAHVVCRCSSRSVLYILRKALSSWFMQLR